jgi:alkylated DNA repair dioxygenase AlkB
MSVAMTNCGNAGWVSDRTGYRYDAIDPESKQPWPAMPPVLCITVPCRGRAGRTALTCAMASAGSGPASATPSA